MDADEQPDAAEPASEPAAGAEELGVEGMDAPAEGMDAAARLGLPVKTAEDEASREMAWIRGAALLGVIRAALRRWFLEDCETDLVQMGRDALDKLAQGPLLDL